MKSGLCIVYTSLLSILVLSSCALFLLVLSESLHAGGETQAAADLSGLHNVSKKHHSVSNVAVPSPQIPEDLPNQGDAVEDHRNILEDHEMTFAGALSLNSVTTDGLPDTGQPPILISLGESAKFELNNPDEFLHANESEERNDTTTFSVVDGTEALDGEKEGKETADSLLIVKAKPMHETRQTTSTTAAPEEIVIESQIEVITEPDNIPIKPETPQEDIPSFSEWAQKQLAEAEKKDTVLNQSSQPSHSNTNFSSKSTRLRSKNYASLACGAKVVAANPEAGSATSILSPNRDEYMLNSCNSRIWFVVELCEAVQAQKIEIANFELFSSTPKDIAVYFSDRFPTRDWASVGQFTAKDERDVQSFDLYPHLFGKFIKVEMLSHHGSEHYCPISLFKVYGTSEFEVLEKESSQHSAHIDDDEDDEIDIPDTPSAETETKNLFGSARDAVMSIMKKAAQVLVKTEVPNKNMSSEYNDTSADSMYKRCCSPSHIIVCDNCSKTLYNDVYELISCSSDKLTNLVRQVFLRETLKCTNVCQPYGLDFKSTKTIEFATERVAYVNALFPQKYLAALCNILAIKEKKVVLNTSFETETNVTTNITVDEHPKKANGETNIEQEIKLVLIKNNDSLEEESNDTVQVEDKADNIEQASESAVIEEIPVEDVGKLDDKHEEMNTSYEETPVQERVQTEETKGAPEEKPTETKPDSEAKDVKIEVPTEKPKENNGFDEINDQIVIDNDNFMTEFDQMAIDPTPAGTAATQSQNQAQSIIQKESVFLRLSNRVKTLERNMSLSGQYLEELSRRYKRQVEEMQRTFEKTVSQMTEERRKNTEREQKYFEQMTNLQEKMAQMTTAMTILMEERDSWFGNMTFVKFLIFQSFIIAGIFYYFSKRRKPEPILVPISKKTRKKDKFRRKSVEGVSGHATPSAKKRRPSEEALHITRQSAGEQSKDEDDGEWQIAKKNRKRKVPITVKSVDTEYFNKENWKRQDSLGELQENPIALDEEEYLAPVPEPVEFHDSDTVRKEPPKTNGSIFNNLKTKALKSRRLSSPTFLRTLSRQSSRSTPSPVVRTLEPVFNGKNSKKSNSESPTGSLWSESTEISQNGPQDSESGNGKKKKSLKNIFRKVF